MLFGPGDIRVTERQVPVPGPDEVLVKVAMCGTCGTDLKILDGRFPQTPPFGAFIPGHEWTGAVAATGSGVDEFAAGDRVCIEAHRGCGRLELGRRLGADHVIDASAADPSPVTFDLSAVVRKDITIHTSRGQGGGNVRRAISLAARGKLRGAEMVTNRFGLDDISEAFRVVRERIGDPVKVVIIP